MRFLTQKEPYHVTHVVEILHQVGSYFKPTDFILNPIGKKAPQAAQKFETLFIFENSLQQEFWKKCFRKYFRKFV